MLSLQLRRLVAPEKLSSDVVEDSWQRLRFPVEFLDLDVYIEGRYERLGRRRQIVVGGRRAQHGSPGECAILDLLDHVRSEVDGVMLHFLFSDLVLSDAGIAFTPVDSEAMPISPANGSFPVVNLTRPSERAMGISVALAIDPFALVVNDRASEVPFTIKLVIGKLSMVSATTMYAWRQDTPADSNELVRIARASCLDSKMVSRNAHSSVELAI